MASPPLSRRIGATAGKALFGVAVFVSTTVAWSRFGGEVMRHFPLPGGDGATGPCAVWFVGSSSIYRWTSMAHDMAPWQVANRGVNGASVLDVSARLSAERSGPAPGYIVFYIGENDIAAGASAADVERQVAGLVRWAHARMPQTRMVVVGLKPSPARWSFRPEQRRFDALAAAAAERTGLARFIHPADALLVGDRPGPFYQPDGVHLDANGYRRWGRALRVAFERTVPSDALARCTQRKAVRA